VQITQSRRAGWRAWLLGEPRPSARLELLCLSARDVLHAALCVRGEAGQNEVWRSHENAPDLPTPLLACAAVGSCSCIMPQRVYRQLTAKGTTPSVTAGGGAFDKRCKTSGRRPTPPLRTTQAARHDSLPAVSRTDTRWEHRAPGHPVWCVVRCVCDGGRPRRLGADI
jgi:hypothetical protein